MDKELHRIAVTCIIHKDGKYLITRRSLEKKRNPGKWTVPGGGFSTDDYESLPKTKGNAWYYALTNAVRREVREETGLEIGQPEYLLDLAAGYGDGVPTLVISYFAEYTSGEIVLDTDSIEYAWIIPEDAKNYELVGDLEGEIKTVDDILKKRK